MLGGSVRTGMVQSPGMLGMRCAARAVPVSARGGDRFLRGRHDEAFPSRPPRGGGDDARGIAARGKIGQDLGAQRFGLHALGDGIGGIDLDAEARGLRADLRDLGRLRRGWLRATSRPPRSAAVRLPRARAGSGGVLAAGAAAGCAWSSGAVVIIGPFPLGLGLRVDVPRGAAAKARKAVTGSATSSARPAKTAASPRKTAAFGAQRAEGCRGGGHALRRRFRRRAGAGLPTRPRSGSRTASGSGW